MYIQLFFVDEFGCKLALCSTLCQLFSHVFLSYKMSTPKRETVIGMWVHVFACWSCPQWKVGRVIVAAMSEGTGNSWQFDVLFSHSPFVWLWWICVLYCVSMFIVSKLVKLYQMLINMDMIWVIYDYNIYSVYIIYYIWFIQYSL